MASKAPVNTTPSPTAIRRLSRDLQKLQEEPIDGIDALPLEENILEWHYVIRGSKGTAFEGGLYHGKLVFPCEFPWKPPSIYMFTPNGRFLPNQRLCLSISDYHPETWNPGWTVSAILVGLHSFMNESSIATGTETTTEQRKKELAVKSSSFNLRDGIFCKLFPKLVTEIQSKGVEKMSDAEAQVEKNRTAPRYARVGGLPGEPDFFQNARQQMMAMQNEMEAAMRAAILPPQQGGARNPFNDDLFFGIGGGGDPPQQQQQQQQHQLPQVGGGGPPAAAGPAGLQGVAQRAAAWLHLPPRQQVEQNVVQRAPRNEVDRLLDRYEQEGVVFQQPQPRAPAAAAAAVVVAAVAGPLHPRRAGDDPADLEPPPPKRSPPDVVILD